VIGEFFWGWTPMAVSTALAAGIAVGEVLWRLRIFATRRKMEWGILIIGLFWYLTQNVRIAVDPDTTINLVRNIGASSLWFVAYAGAAILWCRWRHKA
jgi:hypothetical protein